MNRPSSFALFRVSLFANASPRTNWVVDVYQGGKITKWLQRTIDPDQKSYTVLFMCWQCGVLIPYVRDELQPNFILPLTSRAREANWYCWKFDEAHGILHSHSLSKLIVEDGFVGHFAFTLLRTYKCNRRLNIQQFCQMSKTFIFLEPYQMPYSFDDIT